MYSLCTELGSGAVARGCANRGVAGLDALHGPIAELFRTKYHHVVSARTVRSITTRVCLMCLTVLPLICGGKEGTVANPLTIKW